MAAGAYRTDADDDILLLATDINGFGFFKNAGATRRQGVDLHLAYRDTRLTFSVGYAHLDAIFLNAQTLSSNKKGRGVHRARCVSAWSIFPTKERLGTSYSSLSSPTSLADPITRSNRELSPR